jgi:hypothetical protein
MACREAPTFERYVSERIGTRSEAGKMIATLAKDTSLSNAISLTIEALPAGKSRDLRQIVDLFEPYCEWVEEWEPEGWEVEVSRSHVILRPPKDYAWGRAEHPNNDVVAAAAGVLGVKFDEVEFDPKLEVSFVVTR